MKPTKPIIDWDEHCAAFALKRLRAQMQEERIDGMIAVLLFTILGFCLGFFACYLIGKERGEITMFALIALLWTAAFATARYRNKERK